jgi:aspartyl/glutamyl-tRNA(Asn/Gln) amidotransferase C subunit
MDEELVTIADIEHLAEMSGLEFSDIDKRIMQEQVNGILDMFNGCAEADETVIEKTKVVSLEDLRDDEEMSSLKADQVFMNTPESKQGYIVVSKVVD